MTLLDLAGVSFAYGDGKTVLQGIDLSIRAGRNLGIVGESGFGKTTLLKLLLGLERVSAGTVAFRGESLDTADRSFMRGFRRSVQAVSQDPYSSLDPRQRVFDIIAEPWRSLKIETDIGNAVAEALRDVDLPADVARRYPHEFSGGQRQRIAIARRSSPSQVSLSPTRSSAPSTSPPARASSTSCAPSRPARLLSWSRTTSLLGHCFASSWWCWRRASSSKNAPHVTMLARPAHSYTKRLLESVPRMPRTG